MSCSMTQHGTMCGDQSETQDLLILESDARIPGRGALIYEPSRGKTNNVASEQVRHKPTCTVTEKS